jgi:hypothetical protein
MCLHGVDILMTISGVDFDDAYRARKVVLVEGLRLPFLGLAELLANKRAAGRPKDLLDVALLEEHGADRGRRGSRPGRRRR